MCNVKVWFFHNPTFYYFEKKYHLGYVQFLKNAPLKQRNVDLNKLNESFVLM